MHRDNKSIFPELKVGVVDMNSPRVKEILAAADARRRSLLSSGKISKETLNLVITCKKKS